MDQIIEYFKPKVNILLSNIYNLQNLSFEDKEISSIIYGIDWLVENMTEI